MKKQFYTIIALIFVLNLSSVTGIYAESGRIIRAHIPFQFSVGNKIISEGNYLIKREDNNGAVWSISGIDNRTKLLFVSNTVATKGEFTNAKLIFHRFGDKYFLAAFESISLKINLRKSTSELAEEIKLKQNDPLAKFNPERIKPEIVVINLVN
jgi:hypothetical protein